MMLNKGTLWILSMTTLESAAKDLDAYFKEVQTDVAPPEDMALAHQLRDMITTILEEKRHDPPGHEVGEA